MTIAVIMITTMIMITAMITTTILIMTMIQITTMMDQMMADQTTAVPMMAETDAWIMDY